jgi:hypothetical protein
MAPLIRALSNVSIDRGGIRVRNFPRRTRLIPLSSADRFDWENRLDGRTCVLRLRDGTTVDVDARFEGAPGAATILNNRLGELRS